MKKANSVTAISDMRTSATTPAGGWDLTSGIVRSSSCETRPKRLGGMAVSEVEE